MYSLAYLIDYYFIFQPTIYQTQSRCQFPNHSSQLIQLCAIYGKQGLSLKLFSGREYGTASIDIHVKSCAQKWEIEENKKPPRDRRPVPEPPKNFDEMLLGAKMNDGNYHLEEYNNEAYKQYNEKVLMPCHNCGRRFLPDRLEVHLRSCDKDYQRKAQNNNINDHERQQSPHLSGDRTSLPPSISASQINPPFTMPQGAPSRMAANQSIDQSNRSFIGGSFQSNISRSQTNQNSGSQMSQNAMQILGNSQNPYQMGTPLQNKSPPYLNSPDMHQQKSMKEQPQGTIHLNGGGSLPQCNLCGRQFSAAIMEQHVRACQKRWVPPQPPSQQSNYQ